MAGSNNANLDCKVVADTGHILGVEMMDTLLAAKKNAACNCNFRIYRRVKGF